MPTATLQLSPYCAEGIVTQSCTFLTLEERDCPLREHTPAFGVWRAVLAELPYLGSSSTLGCELQFVQLDTAKFHPTRSKLGANYCCYVIARPWWRAKTTRVREKERHEYGCRLGMVSKSLLKEGKTSQMVEKRTRTTKTNQKQANHSPQAESPPSCSLSSVLGETSETKTNDYQWA